MKPGNRKMLRKDKVFDVMVNALEKLKAGIRAKVERPFRVVNPQFAYTKVRYRILKKNTDQLVTLFAPKGQCFRRFCRFNSPSEIMRPTATLKCELFNPSLDEYILPVKWNK